MKYTYEICAKLINKVRESNLDTDSKIKLNLIVFDIMENHLNWNENTQMLDYTIDELDKLDEHEYYY